ncbi:hypothetical protein CEP49_03460 [Mergibacter septicus]|uniref:DUF459 domain-containing protein n=1 Tax=Mergibacter septicus TaxID=221402 RepID=UPI0011793783|nr:DUF459 domain-containing protein [Mergibacter septicus]AWX13677.1 hypothetical protein CEP49_03460 [Mergibacter septicus]
MKKWWFLLFLGLNIGLATVMANQQNHLSVPVKKVQQNKTAKTKEHILIIGDSLMRQIGTSLERRLVKQGYKVTNLAKSSSGLVNKKFYNWQQVLANALQQDPNIGLIIAHFGANDTLALKVNNKVRQFYSKEWDQAYRQRLNEIVEQLRANQSLIWLSLPCMKPNGYNKKMQHLNRLMETTLNSRVIWLDTYSLVCSQGKYVETIMQAGKKLRVRIKDGIHFSLAGANLIAKVIEQKIVEGISFVKKKVVKPSTPDHQFPPKKLISQQVNHLDGKTQNKQINRN